MDNNSEDLEFTLEDLLNEADELIENENIANQLANAQPNHLDKKDGKVFIQPKTSQ